MSGWQSVRALSVAVAGLVASLMFVACSGDTPAVQPDPTEPTEPTSDPTTQTPTDEPTDDPTEPEVPEPELPAAATEPTRKGAEAFVRYYVELINYAQATGVGDLMLANARGCRGCENFADLFERTVQDGGFFDRAEWSVRVAVALPGRGRTLDVLTTIDIAQGRYRESSDSAVETLDKNSIEFRVTVLRNEQAWLVDEIASTQT